MVSKHATTPLRKVNFDDSNLQWGVMSVSDLEGNVTHVSCLEQQN